MCLEITDILKIKLVIFLIQLIVIKVQGVVKSAHKNLLPPGWTEPTPFFMFNKDTVPLRARLQIDSVKKYLYNSCQEIFTSQKILVQLLGNLYLSKNNCTVVRKSLLVKKYFYNCQEIFTSQKILVQLLGNLYQSKNTCTVVKKSLPVKN